MKNLGYVFILAVSSAFAFFISREEGQKFVDENTTESVVIGSGIILIGLGLVLRPKAWGKVVAAFVLAGAPMVVRKLLK